MVSSHMICRGKFFTFAGVFPVMRCPEHKNNPASAILGFCGVCIRSDPNLLNRAKEAHISVRKGEGLVPFIPQDGSLVCPDCGNHCHIAEGGIGFCHTKHAKNGKIVDRYGEAVPVFWYYDPLPTNCVADWVCSVPSSLGFGLSRLKNLAVFYGSCNSDCLFCQNTSYRRMMKTGSNLMTPEELARAVDDRTACVCYFGGDPACNPRHSLETSRLINKERHVRVCYETNGNISGKWLDEISDIVKITGGTLKFDLKALNPEIYQALTGVSNALALRNFKSLAKDSLKREGEFLVVSILLVPGYIGIQEIEELTKFIADCDSTIPTALLGFCPHHRMLDLPRTSIAHAESALRVARESGLTNVRIGNRHLLSEESYEFP
ncbi:MAG: radical SAM protein [Candidatus Thorarchaeota archaeon]|nr:radical SAM protein [Candidatus Thorarchaeota archaeon]